MAKMTEAELKAEQKLKDDMDKERVIYHSKSELKRLQEAYKGKDVVFVQEGVPVQEEDVE